MNTHYKIDGAALRLCNAFGFLFPGELFLIQAIARALPENAVVVNIGAGVGTGSLGVVEMRPDVQAYTVDISEGGPNGGLLNEVNAFRGAGLKLPVQILGDSQKVWQKWKAIGKGQGIDFLFIDGDHSATGLQRDIDGWLPFINPGGYALFHDYRSVAWQGITEVVDKNIRGKGWEEILLVDTLIAFRKGPRKVTVTEVVNELNEIRNGPAPAPEVTYEVFDDPKVQARPLRKTRGKK